MCACMHIGIYTFRHACSQTYITLCICMHAFISVNMYACMYACACMCTKCTAISLYTYFKSLNKYDCHIANMNHSVIMLHWHIEPAFLLVYAKTQPIEISISYNISMYGPAKICFSICHVYKLVHNYVSVNTSYELIAINNVTKSTAIYISHYWHMPMNKYVHTTAYICPTSLLL